MQTLTTTIKRQWLAQIVAGTKKIEYREVKPYWVERFAKYTLPFKLRMINGMSKTAPEVTCLIEKMDIGHQPEDPALYDGVVYRLHISKVLSYKNWNKKRNAPSL
jgi:hypothetical protein